MNSKPSPRKVSFLTDDLFRTSGTLGSLTETVQLYYGMTHLVNIRGSVLFHQYDLDPIKTNMALIGSKEAAKIAGLFNNRRTTVRHDVPLAASSSQIRSEERQKYRICLNDVQLYDITYLFFTYAAASSL